MMRDFLHEKVVLENASDFARTHPYGHTGKRFEDRSLVVKALDKPPVRAA
ncbi:MAG TPA: hypothetical protein PKA58_26715 [Polyangium sp.]|nr:hypothetical protein [Polyangium sp.]